MNPQLTDREFWAKYVNYDKKNIKKFALKYHMINSADEFENFYKSKSTKKIIGPIEEKTKFKIEEYPGYYFMDIMFYMDPQSNDNRYLFDIFVFVHAASRKVWAEVIKDKTGNEMIKAFKKIERKIIGENQEGLLDNKPEEGAYPGYKWYIDTILSDKESAFVSGPFHEYLEKRQIVQVFKDTDEHHILGILDRIVNKLKKLFDERYLNMFEERVYDAQVNNTIRRKILPNQFAPEIQKSVDTYNQTPINSIFGFTPNEVFADDRLSDKIYEYSKLFNNLKVKNMKIKLQRGNIVRKMDRRIDKLHQRRKYFSNELYKVKKKHNFSYQLKDMTTNEMLKGRYKPRELKRIDPGEMNLPKRIRN